MTMTTEQVRKYWAMTPTLADEQAKHEARAKEHGQHAAEYRARARWFEDHGDKQAARDARTEAEAIENRANVEWWAAANLWKAQGHPRATA